FAQERPVSSAGLDERGQLRELRDADGRLHIGDLQVVADVREDVLVVIAEREVAELAREALPAPVVLTRRAPAVATPVAARLDQDLELGPVREHGSALAHRD